MRTLVAVITLSAGLAAQPALADTLTCANRDGTVTVEAEVVFTPGRDGGEVGLVKVTTPHIVMSTAHEDTLAFQQVGYDRIEIGLESPNVGPMTFVMDVVRAAEADGRGGPDSNVVVAGVANVASVGTTILECSGWE